MTSDDKINATLALARDWRDRWAAGEDLSVHAPTVLDAVLYWLEHEPA